MIDGELTAQEEDAVRGHLADCSSCREEYETLLETTQYVEILPELIPRTTLWAGIERSLASAATMRPEQPWLLRTLQRRWVPVSAAAGLILAILAGTQMLNDRNPLETQYREFMETRELLFKQHREVLSNRERIQQLRDLRNPFSAPVSLSQANPFRE